MENKELQKLREEYTKNHLDESEVADSPITQFNKWLDEALSSRLPEPNAMNVATVDEDGVPHSRIVLLKEVRETGFVFYTNYESLKGQNIGRNPHVALCFLWLELERQVRIEGVATKLPADESRVYFDTRPYGSRIGALASHQSRVIEDRQELETRFSKLSARYKDTDVPMPQNWGGYLVIPSVIEFWQGRKSRLHDRIRYRRTTEKWLLERLEP